MYRYINWSSPTFDEHRDVQVFIFCVSVSEVGATVVTREQHHHVLALDDVKKASQNEVEVVDVVEVLSRTPSEIVTRRCISRRTSSHQLQRIQSVIEFTV